MKYVAIPLFFAFAITSACSDDSGDSDTPGPSVIGSNTKDSTSKTKKASTTKDSTEAQAEDSSSEMATDDAKSMGKKESTATCLAGSCNTPANLQFSFSSPVSVAPYECSGVSKVRVIDFAQQFWVYSMASCSGVPYLYLQQFKYSGEAASQPTLMSPTCSTSTNYIVDFDVSTSATSMLLAYTCKTSNTAYRLDVRQIKADGTAMATKVLEASTALKEVNLEWNNAGKSYGLSRSSKFLRLQEDGTALGGPIVLPSKKVAQVKIINDYWTIIQDETSNTYKGTICSKVSASGVLACNGNTLGESTYQFAGDSNILKITNFYGDPMKTTVLNFNSDDCSAFNESSTRIPANAPSTSGDTKVFASAVILKEIFLNLFQGRYGLVMAAYKRGSDLSLLSEASIDAASYGEVTQAEMLQANQRLNIYYIKSGKSWLVTSVQKVE